MVHCLFSVDDAAAGGNHRMMHVDRRIEILFDLVKSPRTDGLDQLADQLSLVCLNHDVRVEKSIAGQFCQLHADGALAAARHADENNIIHPNILQIHSKTPFILPCPAAGFNNCLHPCVLHRICIST